MSWRAVDRSPFRFWAAWAPRSWPGAERPRLDLATRRLIWPAQGAPETLPDDLPPEPELVLVPPVPAALRSAREQLSERIARAGGVALAQRSPGEPPPERGIDLLDLTAVVLREPPVEAAGLSGSLTRPLWIAVPLLPGADGALGTLLDVAAALAPEAILGVAPDLTPADRRRIVDRLGEQSFDAVFHGRATREAEFAAAVAARGIAPLPPLPELRNLTARRARDRRLTGALQEAGEIWLRLGRSEAIGEGLLAAARRLVAEPRDLIALAREGNLGLLTWLSPAAHTLIAEESGSGGSALLRELRRAWSGGNAA